MYLFIFNVLNASRLLPSTTRNVYYMSSFPPTSRPRSTQCIAPAVRVRTGSASPRERELTHCSCLIQVWGPWKRGERFILARVCTLFAGCVCLHGFPDCIYCVDPQPSTHKHVVSQITIFLLCTVSNPLNSVLALSFTISLVLLFPFYLLFSPPQLPSFSINIASPSFVLEASLNTISRTALDTLHSSSSSL